MIGYLGVARETFDINLAKKKFDEAKNLIHSLNPNSKGIDELITNNESAIKAINYFKKHKFQKILFFQTTFTDAKFILHFAITIKKPICILAFPEQRSGGRLRLNSICGLNLGMHSLIKNKIVPNFIIIDQNKKNYTKYLSTFIKKNKIKNKVESWKKIFVSKKNELTNNIKKQKIGIIGIKPEGFDTCDYKDREIKEKLNFDLKKISLNNLFEESNKIKKNKIIKTKSMIAKTLRDTKKLNQKEFEKSISIYHGLENLKNKHNVQAFAVRCWPEMFTKFGCASCGPMAMMNEKNISCACEVDVLGSISCNILNQLNGKPSLLVDIVDIDSKDNSLVFWHCGLAPISMSKKKEASADVHSNRRKPLLHNFSLKPGIITIFRVSKSSNKLKFFVTKGEIKNRKNSFSGTSGVVSLGNNTINKINMMFKGGLEHHVAFTYGNLYDEIISLGKKMKIPTYTV